MSTDIDSGPSSQGLELVPVGSSAKARRLVIGLTALAFVGGVCAGLVGHVLVRKTLATRCAGAPVQPTVSEPSHAARGPERGDRDRRRERGRRGPRMGHLVEALELTTEEQAAMHAVFERGAAQFEAMFAEVRPKLDAAREEMHQELRASLPEAKRATFDEVMAGMERGRGDRKRGRPGRGGRFGRNGARPWQDANEDGLITRDEWQADAGLFDRLDADKDGSLSESERRAKRVWGDKDGDGRLSREEWTSDPERFQRIDTNADGYLDEAELQVYMESRRRRPDDRRRPEEHRPEEHGPDALRPAHPPAGPGADGPPPRED